MEKRAVFIEEIPFKVDVTGFLEEMRLTGKKGYEVRVMELIETAQQVGRPKALYRTAFIEERGEDYTVIEGMNFQSHILSVNLQEIFRVFPFVVTSGMELEEWSSSLEDVLEQFWADVLKEKAMEAVKEVMLNQIKEQFQLGNISYMNPGSLQDWPLTEQCQLFKLLGDTKKQIGVELRENLLMYPVKSISGIIFPSEKDFKSCQLCPNEGCPQRKAPYDSDLYEKRFARKN